MPKMSTRLQIALALAAVSVAGAVWAQNPAGSLPNQAGAIQKSFEIRHVETPIKIDGTIEKAWLAADSVTSFIQHAPYELTAPTEPTTVYVLQDDANLYVAFRCYAQKHPPTANYTKDEDGVTFCFDPFGSRTTGYFFEIYGSGLYQDGLVLDDGRDWDGSWEGVWYHADRMYPDRMEVEMKIPFKTIRYKAGLTAWGMQFQRYISASRESDYWTPVGQKDGDLVSRWGSARMVDPHSAGYYFELYPEGFVRRDDYRGEKIKVKPKGSLNLKWDLSPQTSLNATAYPDFAQIESDPFSVNLSRYPTYLDEQRPFFIEGTEIFHLSSFPGSGFFTPLEMFYSRRIGKSLDGETVPIICGTKLTHKSETWDLGGLGAWTDSYHNTAEGYHEPARRFGVLRAKHRMLGNSNVGLIASGTTASQDNYNYAVGADAVLRHGPSEFIFQGGLSDKNGKRGTAIESGYKGFVGKLLTLGTFEAIGDSFDVSDIGYVPWTGRQKLMLISGPFWTFPRGTFSNLFIAPGFVRSREPGSRRWSTLGTFEVNPNLRSHWGGDFEVSYGRNYEATGNPQEPFVGYILRDVSFSTWGNLAGNSINAGFDYGYSYNYYRGYLAWQGTSWITANYSFIPPLRFSLGSNCWVEWTPANQVTQVTERFRPRLEYRFSPSMTVSVFNEMVSATPQTSWRQTRLLSDRVGMLYSWNFAPKSWLLFAVNDFGALDYSRNPAGVMTRQYSISALKVKYLLYL
jgi:hypothetical protein